MKDELNFMIFIECCYSNGTTKYHIKKYSDFPGVKKYIEWLKQCKNNGEALASCGANIYKINRKTLEFDFYRSASWDIIDENKRWG